MVREVKSAAHRTRPQLRADKATPCLPFPSCQQRRRLQVEPFVAGFAARRRGGARSCRALSQVRWLRRPSGEGAGRGCHERHAGGKGVLVPVFREPRTPAVPAAERLGRWERGIVSSCFRRESATLSSAGPARPAALLRGAGARGAPAGTRRQAAVPSPAQRSPLTRSFAGRRPTPADALTRAVAGQHGCDSTCPAVACGLGAERIPGDRLLPQPLLRGGDGAVLDVHGICSKETRRSDRPGDGGLAGRAWCWQCPRAVATPRRPTGEAVSGLRARGSGAGTAQGLPCALQGNLQGKGRARQQLSVSEVRAGRWVTAVSVGSGCRGGFPSSAWPWRVAGWKGVGQECRAG